MKVFFDTNAYVAEALLGRTAEQLIEATQKGSWRILTSSYVLAELERVMTQRLDCSWAPQAVFGRPPSER